MIKVQKHIFIILVLAITILFTCALVCNPSPKFNKTDEGNNTLMKLKDIGISPSEVNINNLNSNGKKNGMWIEETEEYIIIQYYNNGIKDGLELWYDNKSNPIKINCIINYNHNDFYEIIDFDDNGLVLGLTQNIRINNKYPKAKHLYKYVGHHKSYKNGKITAEGDLIFDEEWEIDCVRIGEWKIYDEEGNYKIVNNWPFGNNL